MSEGNRSGVNSSLEQFVAIKEEKHALGVEGPAKVTNKLLARSHVLAKQLKASEEGRNALESLLDHPTPDVRASAATYTLMWNPEQAVPVLEDLVSKRGREFGLIPLEAEYTLIAFRAGKLNMDW
jgi:hypothetical protein